ncbi:hypothetical protein [Janthinobacterium fluminis]|uniref:Uncharacterized protein n=1 Tax=Janthinobacterium fluminis TaxID=2987524 RepID=A0ABT5K3G3_9BURK|nr:hypothetical protein [Janthinobacterium fluminis]MDC8759512.1 hypothetical protein [Janthinobacterium fluminis]
MSNSIAVNKWLKMAKDDDVVVDPSNINHEAIENMWCFSPLEDEAPTINAEDIVDFISQVIEDRRRKLRDKEMLFYCWHDFQCSQLRFSLVSRSHGRLPFGCELSETKELSIIANRVVNEDWRNDDHMQDALEQEHGQQRFALQVFVTNVP